MATIDRAVTARPGAREREPWREQGAVARARWWQDLFAPSQRLRPRAVDVRIAAAIAFVQVVGTMLNGSDELSPWAFDAIAVIPLVVGPVALLFRRRWPEAAVVVAFAGAAAYAASGYPRGPVGLPALGFALVNAIMMGRRAVAWGALLVAYVTLPLLTSVMPDPVEVTRSVPSRAIDLLWLPLVAAGSEIARSRFERRTEQADAAREEARRRASEERLLMARELHDVLAHNISLINVQSGVALHLLDERAEQVRPALQAINEASEEALGELRSVLDVLSRGLDDGQSNGEVGTDGTDGTDGSDGTDGEPGPWAPRSPTAGLRDLDGLVRRTRAAGLDVELTVEGEARPMPAEIDLAAFRIVQEALTNVVRHAGDDVRATVRLQYAHTELVVQVDDDGRGAVAAAPRHGHGGAGDPNTRGRRNATGRSEGSTAVGNGAGRGIPGMRQRVLALGGTFTAGPRPGRGFRVRACLPLQDDGP